MPSSLRFLPLTVALVFGCATATPAPAPATSPGAAIRVDKAPPAPGAQALGTLRAIDGKGCGLFGTRGTYEGALAKLREQAQKVGADYVQLTSVTEPLPNHQCVEKEYTLTGVAFRLAR
jgi:hypothetical protein